MLKNPFLNAVCATLYITGVVSVLSYFDGQTPDGSEPSILVPMALLSLFVLSAAVMGYLFLGQPVMLFQEGKKAEAMKFFFTTVAMFAVITMVLLGVVLYLR